MENPAHLKNIANRVGVSNKESYGEKKYVELTLILQNFKYQTNQKLKIKINTVSDCVIRPKTGGMGSGGVVLVKLE